MNILFAEVTKTFRYYLDDSSSISIAQSGNIVKMHLKNNRYIEFKQRFDEINLTVVDGSVPYYTSRGKERAIALIDEIITKLYGSNPIHNIVVSLVEDITQPKTDNIPII